jgi:WhiB family redox-sensing transcriptional regulator
MNWLDHALCKGLHADFFFPPLEVKSHNGYYAVGKYVCAACPVWNECKEYCDKGDEFWGLWGGLSPQDRKRKEFLQHGSLESVRSGCGCATCKSSPDSYPNSCKLEDIPKAHEPFDLMEIIFVITHQGDS